MDAAKYRHRWEIPMLVVCGIITAIGLALGLAMTVPGASAWLSKAGLPLDLFEGLPDAVWLVLAAPLLVYVYRFYLAAQDRANAIRVGPDQYPALNAIYEDLGRRLEMERLPRLYVINGNGAVNAYALECNRRHRYVVVNAEIAMFAETYPDIVAFVLAHELAHHKLRHVTIWRTVISIIPGLMVLPAVATTRAQEYSADRLALAVCPGHANATRLLASGPWMQQGVNPEAWLQQCEDEHREFFVRVANALSSHAVMVKRYKALRDIEAKGFGCHGEMF